MPRRSAYFLAVIGALAIAACGAARAAAGGAAVVVPLHAERGPFGELRLGIDVMIGDRTVRVLLDTGSAGLRVLAKAAGAARRIGRSAAGGYGSGLVLRGEEATAALAIGDARSAAAAIELVDGYSCGPQRPDCPAANGGTPEMFGALFPGILGISSTDPPNGRCCANPLPALADGVGRRYVVHANFAAPALTLNPDAAAVSAFTMLDVPRGTEPRGCIHFSTTSNDVCGPVLFDTGTPPLLVTTTGVAAQGPFPPGTTATLTIGTWTHAFAIGANAGLRAVVRRADANRIIVGLAAMQSVDVYYDLDGGRIGLLATR